MSNNNYTYVYIKEKSCDTQWINSVYNAKHRRRSLQLMNYDGMEILRLLHRPRNDDDGATKYVVANDISYDTFYHA